MVTDRANCSRSLAFCSMIRAQSAEKSVMSCCFTVQADGWICSVNKFDHTHEGHISHAPWLRRVQAAYHFPVKKAWFLNHRIEILI
jgi:hypothetical protein